MKIPEGYYAVLSPEKESGTIRGKFAEHPGIITYGKDWEEAEKMAHQALNVTLEYEHKHGLKLPTAKIPKHKKGERVIFVRLDPAIQLAYQGSPHQTE